MQKMTIRLRVVIIMILLAALSRILPHPYNFSPLVAMALFGGAKLQHKWMAYLVPLAAYLVSDILLQWSGLMGIYHFSQPFVLISQAFVYLSMILVTLIGTRLTEGSARRILGFSLGGSAVFWVLSNLGVWVGNYFAAGTLTYEPGLTLAMTYIRALPFYNTMSTQLFLGTFLGDLCYSSILFGIFALAQKQIPALRYSKA